MRSVMLKRKSNKFVIIVKADGHSREYVEANMEAAKARANRIKLILGIK